ncbi:SusC/RagA family TonB-linked outer membrane protein [Bacteroides sp.]|uniref:SusC/RagA family TonB-linked outer membrane protein n=1 Tax=Bacteroides sp. TaxID=29523 RepID=UPI002FCC662F
MKKHFILLFLALMGTFFSAVAAGRTVQGVVLSAEDNLPLIGATVYVLADDIKKTGSASSATGVITDIDGKFTITLPDGITRFYCSYVGFDALEVKLVPGKNSYQVTLHPSAHMLDAVVVTGYQTVERRKLTAAVSKLEISDNVLGGVKSIDQALAGQVAGLSVNSISGAPGAPAKIRIRGTASLNGTQDPLWVLDGIPLEGTDIPKMDNLNDVTNMRQSSIAGLNPADIENITVLKDAAATAIYGARAANGVIVITTKSGKVGKPQISFSAKMTYTPTLDISRLNLLTAEEKVGLELDMIQGGYSPENKKGGVNHILVGYKELDAFKKNGWDALSANAQRDINNLKGINTDWNDILFQDAFNQEYNVNLSGGTEKVTYYTSVGYMKENGNVPGVSMDRFNIVGKTSYKVNRMLKLGASLFANRRNNSTYMTDKYGLNNPLMYSRKANPYQLPFDADGNYVYDFDIQNTTDNDLPFNIFEERRNTTNEETINSFSSIFDAELRFNDKLKLISQLGLQLDKTSKQQIADKDSYTMRSDMKSSKYTDKVNGGYKYFLPEGGQQKSYENSNSQITWKAMGEYRDSFKDIHELEVMVGSELRKTWYETLMAATYGFDRKTLTSKPVIFPDETQAKKFPLYSRTYKENAYASFFSTASYSLMNRYTLGGSIRFDGSDLFGVDKKYRFLPLYSVSALWRVSQEPFMKEVRWVDNFVLRTSYGLQGNIDKNTSPFLLGNYSVESILPGGSEDMININGAPNAKLRWEKTHSYNAGFDLAILNQAINLSVDYYYRKGVDLIGSKMLPLETGFVSTAINWASMSNEGIEVAMTTRNITTKNFSWYTNLNFAYNKNTVLKETLSENSMIPGREGRPVGALYALKTAGLDDEGYLRYYNKEGEIVSGKEFFKLVEWGFGESELTTQEHRDLYTYVGSTDAPYTGGLINTFTYKNWELSANLSFNFGGYVRTTPSYNIINHDLGQNSNRDVLDRWTPTNTDTKFPAMITSNDRLDEYMFYDRQDAYSAYRNLDIWIKKVNYMRLQNLRLGYRLPEKVSRMLGMNTASLAVEGRNLFVFGSNYNNFLDPESMGNTYAAPMPKSVTFSLNLSF